MKERNDGCIAWRRRLNSLRARDGFFICFVMNTSRIDAMGVSQMSNVVFALSRTRIKKSITIQTHTHRRRHSTTTRNIQ